MFKSNSCAICGYTITDPVCQRCYMKQTGAVLSDLRLHSMAKEIILNNIKNKFSAESLNDTECVLCKRDNVTLCRHCFSAILRRVLVEISFPEEMMENFESFEVA